MQLLIERGQRKTRIFQRPIFNLWAKFDCTPEENALINEYQVSNYLLIEGRPGDFKRSAIRAGILTVILYFILSFFFGIILAILGIETPSSGNIESRAGTMLMGVMVILIFFICWFLIYRQLREQIIISDMLAGRFFKCRTVFTLITREQEFAELGDCFRLLLEAMKNWGGREVIELRPYKAPTLQLRKLS